MKKFFKYAKKKSLTASNVDEGSVASFNTVSLLSSSDFGSVPSLYGSGSLASVYYVDLKTKDKYFTKLHRAVWLGDLEKVKKLAKKDDVNCADGLKRTPLHLACARGNKEIVWFLLSCKADTSLRDQDGFTPLLRAVQFQHITLVQFLLEQNVDPNETNQIEENALHLAAKENAIDMAMILLQKGANLDCANRDGSTPLHLATYSNYVELAELFLRHGASVNVGDNDERTCLMLAARQGSNNLVSLFLEFGAIASLKDKSGLTAEDYATISEHVECLRLLGQQETVQPKIEEKENDSIKDWDQNNENCEDDKLDSNSILDSWNDESDVIVAKQGLLGELNLTKFLSSLDDSDKDASEIGAEIVRSESNKSLITGPPKPPRTSVGSDTNPKSPRLIQPDDELKENGFLTDETFENGNTQEEKRRIENQPENKKHVTSKDLDLDISIQSDVSTPTFSDISLEKSAKENKEDSKSEKSSLKEKKEKPPVPPPRNSRAKDKSNESISDWDSKSNSGVSLELDKNVANPNDDIQSKSQEILKENSFKCNGPVSPVKIVSQTANGEVETEINNNQEGKHRLYVKHINSHRRTPSGGSVVLKDVHPTADDDVISPYKALTDSESDWSDQEEAKSKEESLVKETTSYQSPLKQQIKEEVNDGAKMKKGVSEISLEAALDLGEEESDWDSSKSEGDNKIVREEEKSSHEIENKLTAESTKDLLPDLIVKEETKDENVIVGQRCAPEGTLGREDTLQGVDEIWEKNAVVKKEDGVSSPSSTNSSQIEDSILRPKCVAGNVANKTNLFEVKESTSNEVRALESTFSSDGGSISGGKKLNEIGRQSEIEMDENEVNETRTRKLGKNLSVDVNALESILQSQLEEQQRISKSTLFGSPSERVSYKAILAQRRHSTEILPSEVGRLNNSALRSFGDRTRSSDSNFSEPVAINRSDAGDWGVFLAKPAIAGSSSDDEVLNAKLNTRSSTKKIVNGSKVKKFQPIATKKSPIRHRKGEFKIPTRKLSLDKFPTLKRLTKRLSLSMDSKTTKETEPKTTVSDNQLELKSSLESVVEEQNDFVQEVLDRLDIRRKSSPSLREVVPERKVSQIGSLDKVSESLGSSSTSSIWDDEMLGKRTMAEENDKNLGENDIDDIPMLSLVKLKDPRALTQLQEFIRGLRINIEKERGERQLLCDRIRNLQSERDGLQRNLTCLEREHVKLKEKAIGLEAKLKTYEWELKQAECKQQENDNKMKKMVNYLSRKEETLLNESSLRQQTEMSNQSLLEQLKTVKDTLGLLQDECKQLQSQFLSQCATIEARPSSPSGILANAFREKEILALRSQLDEANLLCQQVMSDNQSLQLQLNLHKQEVVQCRQKLEKREEWMKAEREKFEKELESSCQENKVSQEALNQTTLSYMVQVNNLEKENKDLKYRLELQSDKICTLEEDLSCHIQELSASKAQTCLLKKQVEESELSLYNEKEQQKCKIEEIKQQVEAVTNKNRELKENLDCATEKIAQLQRNIKRDSKTTSIENQLSYLQEELAQVKRQIQNANAPTQSPPATSRTFHPLFPPASSQLSPTGSASPKRILTPPTRARTARILSRHYLVKSPSPLRSPHHSDSNDSSSDVLTSTSLVKLVTSGLSETKANRQEEVLKLKKEKEVVEMNCHEVENEMQQIETELQKTQVQLQETQLNYEEVKNNVKAMEYELGLKEQLIESLQQENYDLNLKLETANRKLRTIQAREGNEEEIGDLKTLVVQLENEAKELRIQTEEAKMHSHKLTDELLQVRMDYQHSEESLIEETNQRQLLCQQLQESEKTRDELASRVRSLEEDRVQLLARLEKEVGDHRHLWEVEARDRAELALRLLDIEQKQNRPSTIVSIGDTEEVVHRSTLYQKLIQQKDDVDLQLKLEKEKCESLQVKLNEITEKNKEIERLEKHVKDLQELLKREEETNQNTKESLTKAKQKISSIPNLKKQIAHLEQIRSELRAELIDFREQVQINYVNRNEFDKITHQLEATYNYDLQCAINEMKMKFNQQNKIYSEVEQMKLNNEVRFRSDLQRSNDKLTQEINRLELELTKSQSRADSLQDQCNQLRELYELQVELRAKMSKETQQQLQVQANSAQMPLVLRNNSNNINYFIDANKMLHWRKDTPTPTPNFDEKSIDFQDSMFYKIIYCKL